MFVIVYGGDEFHRSPCGLRKRHTVTDEAWAFNRWVKSKAAVRIQGRGECVN